MNASDKAGVILASRCLRWYWPHSSSTTLTLGTRLDPYEIVAPLGAGGMGEVYRALDMRLKREVALKIMPEAFARDPDRMQRLLREADDPCQYTESPSRQ